MFLLLFADGGGVSAPAEEPGCEVDGHGKDDGGVVLGRDAVQGLEITELEIHSEVRETLAEIENTG